MLKPNAQYLVKRNLFIKCQSIIHECSMKDFLRMCGITSAKNYDKDKFSKKETEKLSKFLNMDRTLFLRENIPFTMPEKVTLHQYINLERVINFENIPQYEFAYLIGLSNSNKKGAYTKIKNYISSKPSSHDYRILAEAFDMDVLELRNLPITPLPTKSEKIQQNTQVQTELHDYVDYDPKAKIADLEFKNQLLQTQLTLEKHKKQNTNEKPQVKSQQLNLFLQLLTNQDESGLESELSEAGLNENIISKLLNGDDLTTKQLKMVQIALF